MKRKLILTVLFALVMVCLLATVVMAETFTVNYAGKATATTDENGQITIRTEKVANLTNITVSIENSEGVTQDTASSLVGWYSLETGEFFMPGETITLTSDVTLSQASGFHVYNLTDLKTSLGYNDITVILETDITTDALLNIARQSGQRCQLVLNGHSITSTAAQCFDGGRSGIRIFGDGTITHTGTTAFVQTARHGAYGDGKQGVYIGTGVTVNTAAPLFYGSNNLYGTSGIPQVNVFGIVTAESLVHLKTGAANNGTIYIAPAANVTITGSAMVRNSNPTDVGDALQFVVTIEGGNITVPTEFSWYENSLQYTFNVTGGTFNVAPDSVMLSNGYKAIYDEETALYTVTRVACTANESGEHSFVMGGAAEGYDAVSCLVSGVHVFSCACGESYIQRVESLGHDCSIITIVEEAVLGTNGTKRATCTRCEYYYDYEYAFNPTDVVITVVYVDGNGNEIEYTAKAGEIYDMTVVESVGSFNCTINSVKNVTIDGATYGKASLVKLVVPSGVNAAHADFFKNYSALKEILIMKDVTLTLANGSIYNNAKLEKIVVESDGITFDSTCAHNKNPLLTTIDVSKASATFKNNAFKGHGSVTTLLLGSGNTYYFGEYSFGQGKLEEVIIPDGAKVTLKKKCFAETKTIKYVYIGAGCVESKQLGDATDSSIFGGNGSLEKVVLMDIELIGTWVLSVKTSGDYAARCDLYIYSHAPSLTIRDTVEKSSNQSAFNDRNAYNVYIYSAGPVYSEANGTETECNFNVINCKYTVYSGLGHAYEKKVVSESTCTTPGKYGYDTLDCTCGLDYRDNAYKIFSNIDTSIVGEYPAYNTLDEELPLSTEHTVSDIIIDIVFANGMTENGAHVYKCLYCDKPALTEEKPTCPAIFVAKGYSYALNGTASIMQGFAVNFEVLDYYKTITGKNVLYGLVVAVKDVVGTADLIDTDGTAKHAKVACVSFDNRSYDLFEMKLIGLDETQLDLEVYLCAYYIVDGNVYYINDGVSDIEAPVALTYNKVVAKVENGTEIEAVVNKED